RYPRPNASRTPGRKFSTSTSLDAASRFNTSWPSRIFRFNTRLRLPRLTALKLGLSIPTAPGICRVESPAGGSILITSAPKSASSIAQNGPAITCVTSRTRRPSSAPRVRFIRRLYSDGGTVVHHDTDDLRNRRAHRDADVQPSRGAQRDDVGDVR